MHSDDEQNDDLEYLKRLDAFFDNKEQTTLYLELERRNLSPDHSENLSDEEVSRALTNLIWSLADVHVYIEDTDHLSDRELYKELLDYCDEPTACIVGMPDASIHWSPIGGWSAEDLQVWFRYYATPEERAEHSAQYPEDPMPPSELPPHPRPWLPVRVWEADGEEEDDEPDL